MAATKVHAASTEAPAQEAGAAGANGSASPRSLLRDSILAAGGSPPTPATLAGFPIWIRGLSGAERSAWDAEQYRRSGGANDAAAGERAAAGIRGRLLVRCIIDEDGMRVFTDADAPVLDKREGEELEPLFDIALRRSGLSDAEVAVIQEGLKAASDGSGTA